MLNGINQYLILKHFMYEKNYAIDEIKSSFMQIYVALEDQTLENGCMKIIPYQDNIRPL